MGFLAGLTFGVALTALAFLPFTLWLQREMRRQGVRYQALRAETDTLRESLQCFKSQWIEKQTESLRH